MGGFQTWKREFFGFSLRVWQADDHWEGEINTNQGVIVKTGEFPDLDTALYETCRMARERAGQPPTSNAEDDPCGNTGGWVPSTNVNDLSR